MSAFDGGESRPQRGPLPKGKQNTNKNAKNEPHRHLTWYQWQGSKHMVGVVTPCLSGRPMLRNPGTLKATAHSDGIGMSWSRRWECI